LLFPELPVMLDPFGCILHRLGHEPAAIDSSILAPCDKLCPFEHSQVLGNPREGDVEGRRQVADGGFTSRQTRQDAAPGSVGEGGKDGVQLLLGILNHMV